MWVEGLSPHTEASYRYSAAQFFSYINKPLALVELTDLQLWLRSLSSLTASSKKTRLVAVKSLLSFAHKIGVLEKNPGVGMRHPKVRDTLNERILSVEEVQAILNKESSLRNRLILRLLYSGGLRVSELCALKWKDFLPRGDSGQVTVFGKGGKTRTVLLSEALWAELMKMKCDSPPTAPVFAHIKDPAAHLDRTYIFRIVRAAGERAGIQKVSPHWLRHAHASHSLDRGAPLHLVQHTLGHASVTTTSRYLHARPNDSSALYLPD